MLFENITILGEDYAAHEGMFVGVSGEKITYVSDKAPTDTAAYGERYDGAGKILLPGFCDAHTHLPMALMRGYGENVALMDWLNRYCFPFEAKLRDEDVYYGAQLSIAEALRFGITSCTEMYMCGKPLAEAIIDSGIKSSMSLSITCFTAQGLSELPVYDEVLRMVKAYNGAADGRLVTDMCLHAEYTSSRRIASEVAQTAKELGIAMHVHVAETASEVEACKQRHEGLSPVKYLADCGIFDMRTTAAHCVWVDDEDIAVLREKNVTVATNPKSNLKLASGICPVTRLLDAGVNVAVGTDSVASNNNLNMLEELKFMSLLQKYNSGDASAITPAQLFRASSRAGYLSQGRTDCGIIKEGFRADLCVIDIDKPYMKPVYNILNNLIFSACGTDVCLTMVDGRTLYRDGEFPTLDIERIEREVERSRKRILGELAGE